MTTAVLVLALIVSAFSPIGAAVLLAAQAVVFAIGAFLNAAFAICLGCQLYPLVARFRRAPSPA